MLRVLVDSNIIVGAIRDPGCASARVARLVTTGKLTVVLSDLLLREVARAVSSEFGRSEGKVAYRMLARAPSRHIVWRFEWEHLEEEVRSLVLDRGDVPHVCAALEGRADAFVTLDGKLARMPIRHRLTIVRPEVMLKSLEGPGGP